MELHYIREFVLLSNIGNFQEAADALYISQSTLSRHIQALEKELQNKLFDRTTRNVQISDFGRFFLPYARELVCIEHDFFQECYSVNKQPYETIHVAAIPAMAPYHFTDILASFQREYPNYRIEVTEISSLDTLYDDMANGSIDFALIHDPEIKHKHIVYSHLFTDKLVAALPDSHPLSGLECLDLYQVKNESFLTMPMESIVCQRFISACRQSEFTPCIGYSGHKEDVILSLAKNHFGIGILPKQTAEFTRHDRVHLIDIVPAISIPVSLSYLDSLRMTTGKKLFYKSCQKISEFSAI